MNMVTKTINTYKNVLELVPHKHKRLKIVHIDLKNSKTCPLHFVPRDTLIPWRSVTHMCLSTYGGKGSE